MNILYQLWAFFDQFWAFVDQCWAFVDQFWAFVDHFFVDQFLAAAATARREQYFQAVQPQDTHMHRDEISRSGIKSLTLIYKHVYMYVYIIYMHVYMIVLYMPSF